MSGSYRYPDLKLHIPDHMRRKDEEAKFGASSTVLSLADFLSLVEPLAEEERRRDAMAVSANDHDNPADPNKEKNYE